MEKFAGDGYDKVILLPGLPPGINLSYDIFHEVERGLPEIDPGDSRRSTPGLVRTTNIIFGDCRRSTPEIGENNQSFFGAPGDRPRGLLEVDPGDWCGQLLYFEGLQPDQLRSVSEYELQDSRINDQQ